MFEMVTVEAALKKGKRSITTPSMIMLLGLVIITIYLAVSQIMPIVFLTIAIPLCIILPWLFWSLKIANWRLWAFENVRNVHELKTRAIEEKLIYKDNSFYNKTEIWTKRQREQWHLLQEKFNIQDIFNDDLTIPEETAIYFSKGTSYFQMIVLLIGVAGGICLMLVLHSYLFGAIFTIVLGFLAYKAYQQAVDKNPQIILNQKGIQTKSAGFQNWDVITNEEVRIEGYGKNTKLYFAFNYPSGSERLCISDLEIGGKELNNMLRIYRGRYNRDISKRQ